MMKSLAVLQKRIKKGTAAVHSAEVNRCPLKKIIEARSETGTSKRRNIFFVFNSERIVFRLR